MMPKYYMLSLGLPIRVTSKAVWEAWFRATPADERLLASSIVENLTVETWFTGIVSEHGGAHESTVAGQSAVQSTVVRRYQGIDRKAALQGHLKLVDEIRSQLVSQQGR